MTSIRKPAINKYCTVKPVRNMNKIDRNNTSSAIVQYTKFKVCKGEQS